MGKGSKPRPFSVDKKTFDDNWEKIFGKTNERRDGDSEGTSKGPEDEQASPEVAND